MTLWQSCILLSGLISCLSTLHKQTAVTFVKVLKNSEKCLRQYWVRLTSIGAAGEQRGGWTRTPGSTCSALSQSGFTGHWSSPKSGIWYRSMQQYSILTSREVKLKPPGVHPTFPQSQWTPWGNPKLFFEPMRHEITQNLDRKSTFLASSQGMLMLLVLRPYLRDPLIQVKPLF